MKKFEEKIRTTKKKKKKKKPNSLSAADKSLYTLSV